MLRKHLLFYHVSLFMGSNSIKKEFIWFGALLIVFLSFLMLVGSPEYFELMIATASFTFSWFIVSYCVKRFGIGSLDMDSLKKELIWFGALLIAFLSFLVIAGSPKLSELVIATAIFTFIWIIRSYVVKTFATSSNKDEVMSSQ